MGAGLSVDKSSLSSSILRHKIWTLIRCVVLLGPRAALANWLKWRVVAPDAVTLPSNHGQVQSASYCHVLVERHVRHHMFRKLWRLELTIGQRCVCWEHRVCRGDHSQRSNCCCCWCQHDASEPWHRRALLDIAAVYCAVVLLAFLTARAFCGASVRRQGPLWLGGLLSLLHVAVVCLQT